MAKLTRRLTVLCPGLEGPAPRNGDAKAAHSALVQGLELPALELLRARAHAVRRDDSASAGPERLLFEAFRYGEVMPAGPLGYARDLGQPPAGFVLRVDPVSLQADAADLHLADAAPRGLTSADAAALVDTLNGHFAGDPGELVAGAPGRWYLVRRRPLDAAQRPPSEALGVPLSRIRATGKGARIIGSFMNEAQMLLHQHPVNEERASLGLAPVNTPWPWGGAMAVTPPAVEIEVLAGGGATGAALAHAAGVEHLSDEVRWSDDLAGAGQVLVAVDGLDSPARTMDIDAWRGAVTAVETAWLRPALASLRARTIDEVEVRTGRAVLRLTRMRLRQFWKR